MHAQSRQYGPPTRSSLNAKNPLVWGGPWWGRWPGSGDLAAKLANLLKADARSVRVSLYLPAPPSIPWSMKLMTVALMARPPMASIRAVHEKIELLKHLVAKGRRSHHQSVLVCEWGSEFYSKKNQATAEAGVAPSRCGPCPSAGVHSFLSARLRGEVVQGGLHVKHEASCSELTLSSGERGSKFELTRKKI
jgi:hypothetical protein